MTLGVTETANRALPITASLRSHQTAHSARCGASALFASSHTVLRKQQVLNSHLTNQPGVKPRCEPWGPCSLHYSLNYIYPHPL